jgi:NAD kinase
MGGFQKVVVVTRKTALEELVERFNTRDQARFYIEHMGGSFSEYQAAHERYRAAIEGLRGLLPRSLRYQWIDRAFLPNFTFDRSDIVVTIGPDGLVVNTAKYLDGQPLIAVNPDPSRIDGVLLPFGVGAAIVEALNTILTGRKAWRDIRMAKAELNDGQTLLAVNDLFLGQKTHVSARYRIRCGGREEDQSSSGILVSTGAGSTGWLRSVHAGAAGVMEGIGFRAGMADRVREGYRFDWESRHLVYSVREPFVSRTSEAGMVFGRIEDGEAMEVVSHMPQNGVIFSDGVEEDHLDFNSGAIARIGVAEKTLLLVVPRGHGSGAVSTGAGGPAHWDR